MKFSLCGGLDAPDWILSEILTLSNLTSLQVQRLGELAVQRIQNSSFDREEILKLPKDLSLDLKDVKAALAGVHFIIESASKYNVDEKTLFRELQQWGLPKEHSEALCLPYQKNKILLQKKMKNSSLKVPSIAVKGWQVQISKEEIVRLHLTFEGGSDSNSEKIELSGDKFRVLLRELKSAKALMDKLTEL